MLLQNDNEYLYLVEKIRSEITNAQYRATLSINKKLTFPDSKGYSVRKLKYMSKFASVYPDIEFVQQAVAQIPRGHTVLL